MENEIVNMYNKNKYLAKQNLLITAFPKGLLLTALRL